MRRALNEKLTLYNHALRDVAAARAEAIRTEVELVDIDEARQILQTVSQVIQEEAHNRIAAVVSRCLETVFDDPYEFTINFEQKRGRTEAQLLFVKDEETLDPLTQSGGGVVDVAAFALRLACLVLSRPPVRRLLIMDEPFRFLSKDYRPAVRGLLNTLAKEMGVQFIIVTHDPEFQLGTVVEVKR